MTNRKTAIAQCSRPHRANAKCEQSEMQPAREYPCAVTLLRKLIMPPRANIVGASHIPIIAHAGLLCPTGGRCQRPVIRLRGARRIYAPSATSMCVRATQRPCGTRYGYRQPSYGVDRTAPAAVYGDYDALAARPSMSTAPAFPSATTPGPTRRRTTTMNMRGPLPCPTGHGRGHDATTAVGGRTAIEAAGMAPVMAVLR